MKVKAPKKNKIKKKTPTGKTRKTQARKVPARKAPQRLPPGSLRNPFERTRILGPTHLRHYRIVKKIGSGSYGKVYKAVSPHDTEVAMKLVDLKDTKFDEFQKEYGLTAFLAKNGVGPKIFDGWHIKGAGNDVGVMVSELWDTTLGAFMDESDKRTVPKNVIKDIERELSIMHRLGYVDLDLHEDNVLVRLDPKKRKIVRATLCDFGLAKHIEDVTSRDIADVIDDYEIKTTTKDPKKLDFLMVREIEKQWK